MPYTDANTPKRRPKGYPAIRSNHGRLQLRVSWDGRKYYLSLGVPDNPRERVRAEDTCDAIYQDIRMGRFDPELISEYLPVHLRKKTSKNNHASAATYTEIWTKYDTAMQSVLAETTLSCKHPSITKILGSGKPIKVKDPDKLIALIFGGCKWTTGITRYKSLSAACTWAVKQKLLPTNPLIGIELPHDYERVEKGGDPFETWEIDLIVSAFENTYGIDWASIIKMLLLTGARPSELFALRWEDVNLRTRLITFSKRRNCIRGQIVERGGLKTQPRRKFPISVELLEIIEQAKQRNPCGPTDYVASISGRPIDSNPLGRRWYGKRLKNRWDTKGVVVRLAEDDAILRYRPPYSLRDTFITHSLKSGVPIHTVAKWVGNSPAVIDRHYAGALAEFLPPSLLSPS